MIIIAIITYIQPPSRFRHIIYQRQEDFLHHQEVQHLLASTGKLIAGRQRMLNTCLFRYGRS